MELLNQLSGPDAEESYTKGYRHALQELIMKLATEMVTLHLESNIDPAYINGIERASDVAYAMLTGVQGD